MKNSVTYNGHEIFPIIQENAKIKWLNFGGNNNRNGINNGRGFSLVIEDEEVANDLAALGWVIKEKTATKNNGEPSVYWVLGVKIRYDKFPPKIVLVKPSGMEVLREDNVGLVDSTRYTNIDLTITPYHWDNGIRDGISAYLSTMYITVDEAADPFASKYAEMMKKNLSDTEMPFET